MTRKRVGDLLLESGLISNDQLLAALKDQQQTKGRLGDVLIQKGYITEQQLIEVLEFQLGIPHVQLYKLKLDPTIVNIIPERMAIEYQVIPIRKDGNKLVLAMSDPLDYFAIDNIRMTTGFHVEPVIASKNELQRVIHRFYGLQETLDQVMQAIPKEELQTGEQVSEQDAPVIKMVNQILKSAVQQGASDIHFDPQEDVIRVRFRIDGNLRLEQTLPTHMQGVITSRLKIMANLNIAEKRLPQDGRLKTEIDYKEIDIRVSTLPTVHGEKIVLRVLDLSNAIQTIQRLGFSKENEKTFERMIQFAHGIILITGPTGSGKTSTLYAALNKLNDEDVNIITVEDPVEYQLKGINQVQVNEKTGMTFAKGLRSILRQDPNIIMVGEIRDSETAEIAVRAALTGHLVMSTLHTNDAANAITRLIDMGIEPFLVSSSLVGIVSQRLVRRICPDCITSYTPTDEERKLFEKFNMTVTELWRGKGCGLCQTTGYKGRMPIHEVWIPDDTLRKMVLEKRSDHEYRAHMAQAKYKSLMEDGLRKVKEQVTTVEEVLKVTLNE